MKYCTNHHSEKAIYQCTRCKSDLCVDCIKHQNDPSVTYCPNCGLKKKKGSSSSAMVGGYSGQILRSFIYPLKGKNIFAFFFTVAFVFGVELMSRLPSIVGLIYGILGAGYLASFYLAVVGSSIVGSDEIPEWPEWSSLVRNLIVFYSPFIMSFLPMILYANLVEDTNRWIGIGLTLSGLTYLPMAIGSVAAETSVFATLPNIVLPLIFNDFPKYLLSLGAVILVTVGLAFSGYLANSSESFGLSFILMIPYTYLILIALRVIGLTYANNSDDW